MGYKWAKTIMKKVTLVAMALLCSVAFTNCAAKKPVKPKVDPQQAYIDSLKRAQEIRRLEREMAEEEERAKLEHDAKMAQLNAEKEIATLKASNAKLAISKRVGQDLFTPCIEESYDKPGEYMAGLGIAEGEEERGAAKTNANRYAIADISSRYIGMIKNGVSQYAKYVNTRSGKKVKENEMEGAAEAIGTKLIDKYADNVCTRFEQDDFGGYTCYVAIHVPLKEVVDATVDELGVIQTDIDRQQFRKYMQAELDKQAAEKEAEKKELEEQRKALEQK